MIYRISIKRFRVWIKVYDLNALFGENAYEQLEHEADIPGRRKEIYHLRELKQNMLAEKAEHHGKRQRIAEMTEFLNEQEHGLK